MITGIQTTNGKFTTFYTIKIDNFRFNITTCFAQV